jgi:hypothetical protein
MFQDVGVASIDALFADALGRSYRERALTGTARFVSLGAGNGDTEVRLAKDLLELGCATS